MAGSAFNLTASLNYINNTASLDAQISSVRSKLAGLKGTINITMDRNVIARVANLSTQLNNISGQLTNITRTGSAATAQIASLGSALGTAGTKTAALSGGFDKVGNAFCPDINVNSSTA